MSSHRNPQGNTNRQAGGSKGFAKTQKVFVPKNQGQNRPRSPKSPNPTLSASLRKSLSQPSNAEVSSAAAFAPPESSSRVRMGERGEWVSTKGNFVNYLPQDEAVAASLGADEGGLDAVESQRVVDLLNRELSRLLKLNPKEFWKQVASDTSLREFLESFLQFRNSCKHRLQTITRCTFFLSQRGHKDSRICWDILCNSHKSERLKRAQSEKSSLLEQAEELADQLIASEISSFCQSDASIRC